MTKSGLAAARGTSARGKVTRGQSPGSEREPQAGVTSTLSVSPASVAADSPASRSEYTAAGTRTAEALDASHQSWADSQVLTSSCAFCDWTHEGTALEGREAARAHREVEHPEACVLKARKRRRITKKKLRSASEEAQIKVDAEEARRVRKEREEAEMLAKILKGRERDALDSEAA